jgi:Protein of unknown function (DUF4231)
MAQHSDGAMSTEGPGTAVIDLTETRYKMAEKRQSVYREESAQRAMKAGLGVLVLFWALVAAVNVIRPARTPLFWIDIGVGIASIAFVGYAFSYLIRRGRRISTLRAEISRLRDAEHDAKYRMSRHGPSRLLWMYHSDTLSKIDEYRDEALRYRKIHNRFQTIIIIGALMVTAITTAAAQFRNIEWLAVFVSFFVGISAGMTGYFKFRERSMNLQRAADDLDRECKAVELGIMVYRPIKDEGDRLAEFAERAERIKEDQRNREQQLEQPPETRMNPAQPTPG